MTVLQLNFSAGRFHATPWGRHVNEGAVEWPPSPWRILRALIATWHLKAREIPERTVRELTAALSQSPTFLLPQHAAAAHTRHFMPINKSRETTKVFDTFIHLADGDGVLVTWDVDLPPEQFAALQTLVARLGYFGRAESLVEACLRTDLPQGTEKTHSVSRFLSDDTPQPPKTELVRLLAPMKPTDYDKWRAEFLAANEPPVRSKKKSGRKSKESEIPEAPPDLFAALHADTGSLQAAGWNLPPGAYYVNYVRPENAFASLAKPHRLQSGSPPTVARYAVVGAVPPSIVQAVSIADRVHKALCAWSDADDGRAAVFTGLADDGKPLGGHTHAHVFCEANGPRDSITHITIWATRGFDDRACLALRRLNKIWGRSEHELRLVLYGIGNPADFKDCRLFGSSRRWRSLTPFVSTRHAKIFRDGRPKIADNGWQEGSAPHDLLRLLTMNPKWKGVKLRQLIERDRPFIFGERRLRSLQFRTVRHEGGGKRGHDSGAGFTIEFPEQVEGPIAFGYGSHFGLGLFVPVSE